MVKELNEILRQQITQPAESCKSESGVSFHDQVICPLYEVIAAVCLWLQFNYAVRIYFTFVHPVGVGQEWDGEENSSYFAGFFFFLICMIGNVQYKDF